MDDQENQQTGPQKGLKIGVKLSQCIEPDLRNSSSRDSYSGVF